MRKISFIYFIFALCTATVSLFGQEKDAYVFYLDSIGMQTHSLSPRVYLHQQNKSEPADKGNDNLALKASSIDRIFAKTYLEMLDRNYFEQLTVYKNHLVLAKKNGFMVRGNDSDISKFSFQSGSYDDFKSRMLIHISENKDNYQNTVKALQGKDANANFQVDRESEALENLFFNTGGESIYVVGFYIPKIEGRLDIYEKSSSDNAIAYALKSNVGVKVQTVMYKYENGTFSLAKEYSSTPQIVVASPVRNNANTSPSLTPQKMKNASYQGFAQSLKDALAQTKASLRNYSAFRTRDNSQQLAQNPFDTQDNSQQDFIQGDREIITPQDSMADDIFIPPSNTATDPMKDSFANIQPTDKQSMGIEPEPMPTTDMDFSEDTFAQTGTSMASPTWQITNIQGKKFQVQLDEQSKATLKVDQLLLGSNNKIAKINSIDENVNAKMLSGSITSKDTVHIFPYSGGIFSLYYGDKNINYQYKMSNTAQDTNMTYRNLGFYYSSNFGYSLSAPALSHVYFSTYFDMGIADGTDKFVPLDDLFEPSNTFQASYVPQSNSNLFNFGLGLEKRFYT